ncbi:hypothetical protein [Falsiroseomonas sp. CW058]|uniref:hypothetical protein n=1 Tax=Falsiroseomonas sp. CW058 TaxID=3388664 RepID=UPI003D310347
MLAVLGVSDARAPLIQPDAIRTPLALMRAQSATRATAPGADGVSWAEFAANLPRHAGTQRRLLLEGQRSNALRNPRAEGAAAGTPGTAPTHWTLAAPGGLSHSTLGRTVLGGVEGVLLRLQGTTAAGQANLFLEAPGAVAAATGQPWTAGVFLAVVAGTLPAGAHEISLGLLELDAGGATLASGFGASVTASLGAVPQRVLRSATLAQVGTQSVRPCLRIATLETGVVVDVTLFIGWPTLEQAALASTPVLPAPGSVATSTRGAEIVTAPFATLFPSGRGTVLCRGLLRGLGGGGVSYPWLLQIDDGGNVNRVAVLGTEFGYLRMVRTSAGASVQVDATGNPIAPGTPFSFGLAFEANGRLALSVNGGVPQVLSGAPMASLTTLRLGNSPGLTTPAFAEISTLQVRPVAISDASLPGTVLALPG